MPLFGNKKNKDNKEKAVKKSVKSDDSKKSSSKDEKKIETSMKDLYNDSTVEVKSKTAEKKNSKEKGRAYRVLVKPLITEKAANLGIDGKYVFEVFGNANKIEIAKAIDEVYGVKPTKVNIINKIGKEVRTGRIKGKRKDWKKAIITLPKGKNINIYEGV